MKTMNVLYLHTHDMGRYNQLYGYAIRTPNFDRVARSGMLFRNAYCAGPTCSPSRAGLLTGQAPHSAGLFGLANMGFSIARPKEHLSWFLREHGFHTALFGVSHEVPDPKVLGYETTYAPETGSFAERDMAAAVEAAKYFTQVQKKQPFFCSVGFLYPHRPFETKLGDLEPERLVLPCGLLDTPETRLDFAQYIASVEHADRCAGIVLDALKRAGLEKNTMIILTTDHGIAFPGMKCTLYDGGIGVTLAVGVPGYPLGEVSDALISQIDIYPTLCELLGLQAPPWIQGTSFVPVLKDRRASIRREVFSEINYHVSYAPERCIRTERFKYICRYYDPALLIRTNVDDGPSKAKRLEVLGRKTYAFREEFYDLMLDPTEHYNCIDHQDYTQVCEDLRKRLKDWMEKTEDPLLKGDIPLPENAITLPRDRKSAIEREEMTW